MKQIPNIFTLFNLFLGSVAIVMALQTETVMINVNEEDISSFNIPESIVFAGLLIFAAALVDFLDGFVARMLKATSEMGKQLDSLSDVVSFGVAPGVILYQLLRFGYLREENSLDISIYWLMPAFIYSCAGAYRLARFNLDQSQQYGFKGVPIPAAGLLVASFPLILHFGNPLLNINDIIINKWFLYTVIILLSWLMVSRLPLMALKFTDYSFKHNREKYILLGIALIAGILLHWLAVPVVFIVYIVLSLFHKERAI